MAPVLLVKHAFVTPRYGGDVFGGRRRWAHGVLAEHLAALDGWTVESALDVPRVTRGRWANDYEPGTTVENGVTVHLLRQRQGRDADFRRLTLHLLARAGEGQRR